MMPQKWIQVCLVLVGREDQVDADEDLTEVFPKEITTVIYV